MTAERMKFERIVAMMPDAVVITDPDGLVRFANAAACNLFGKRDEEFFGTLFGFSVKEGEASEIEVPRGDGRRHAEMRVVACEWNRRRALLAMIRDNTEQKQLSEYRRQTQTMEAIRLLAGGIAHDFNNLLLVMLIYAEMIRAACAQDDPRLPDVTEVLRAVERAQALTRQLLAFSGKHPVQPTAIHLGSLVADLYPTLRRTLPASIEIVTVVADQSWPVLADRNQIEQVIMNLAANAKDAMPDGGRFALEIENRSVSKSTQSVMHGDYVALCATDNGSVIEPAHLDHIFEPFFAIKEHGRGARLGLTTCHSIVAQAGGSIAVESTLGEGTTFTVLLPRARDDVEEASNESSEYQGHETILVVEDDVAVMRVTTSILRSHGYTVMTATNGDEACHVLQRESEKINLVLSDIVMPQLSGPELEKIVADKWPQLPLIFMTGYSEQPVVHQDDGIKIENRPALMKPFRAHTLLRTVREALAHAEGAARRQTRPSVGW